MTHDHDRSKINRTASSLTFLRSEFDQYKGRVDALTETVQKQAKTIEKLEADMSSLRGLKGLSSSLR